MNGDRDELAAGWLGAVVRGDVTSALESVYADTGAAIISRGPTCWASGRCCNFEKHGHRLYVTGLEAAYTIARLPATLSADTSSSLSLPQLAEAARGGCPFQIANLCGVHAIKPLGCRVYFCDKSAQDWQMDLSETMLARIRAIHDDFKIEYRYGEWREMLQRFAL